MNAISRLVDAVRFHYERVTVCVVILALCAALLYL